MSRFVEISTTRWKTYVVELKDDEADDAALDSVDGYDEVEFRVLNAHEVETAIRHADEVIRL